MKLRIMYEIMKSLNKALDRNTNIDLLKTIASLMVIILHYNNKNIGGGFQYATGMNLYLLMLFECFCIGAVNIFILISGYFLIESNKRNLGKPLRLLLQVSLFSLLIYFLRVFTGSYTFSITECIGRIIPVNYYVILYILYTLYYFSINQYCY